MSKPEITLAADTKCQTGEGLFWDEAAQALYFVDIPAGRLFRFDPVSGAMKTHDFGEPLGCLAMDRKDRAVLALKSGITRFDFSSGEKTLLANPEEDRPQNRFNDGAVDPAGRFWLGTMAMNPPPQPSGAFYRLDADHSATRYFDGTFTTNGLTFSPDGKQMYLSDSNPEVRNIYVCDYDVSSGEPSNRRLFFDTRAVAGRPDGATMDAEGCYWMAGVGGWQIVRLTPQGRVDRIIDLPVERPSRPSFGGAKMETLFVTSIGAGLSPGTESRQPWAGGILRIDGLGVKGLSQPRFAG